MKELQYEKLRGFFENNLPEDLETCKEFHALIDKLGKTCCKTEPQCSTCPLTSECIYSDKM